MSDGPLTYRIAAIPGDGVGPEVVAAGRAALEAAGSAFGFEIRWSDIAAGGNAIDAYGVAIRPEDSREASLGPLVGERDRDAVDLGAMELVDRDEVALERRLDDVRA